MFKMAIFVVSVLFVMSGCGSSFEKTVKSPNGTSTVQTVSNGLGGHDTKITVDTERAYNERCMPNRAPQVGSANADRECANAGGVGGQGYGGFTYVPMIPSQYPGQQWLNESYAEQAARQGMTTGSVFVPNAPASTTPTKPGATSVDDAQNKILRSHDKRIEKLEKPSN